MLISNLKHVFAVASTFGLIKLMYQIVRKIQNEHIRTPAHSMFYGLYNALFLTQKVGVTAKNGLQI